MEAGLENTCIQITKIIDDAFVSGTIVSAWDEVKALLVLAQLAWVQQVPPENVGVHKSNRSGEGVGAMQSHNHGCEICLQGWSWTKAADAVAVEHVSDDIEQIEFNDALIELSEGCFPLLVNMILASISASHTNAWLRSVKANCISACPQLADKSGRLNMEEICLNRPALREAIQSGLKWFVISNRAVKRFPRLIDLVQKAMNTRAHESSSETEVMLSMAGQAQLQQQPDWSGIVKAAAFSNPPCKAWLNELVTFVREHAGAGTVLEDLNLFSRALASLKGQKDAGSKKVLGSEFWVKLNTVKWASTKKKPWLLNAVVKANLASPPAKVIDGFCKLVEPRHISMLMSKENLDLVDQAEALMTDARAVLSQLQIARPRYVTVLGKLDARCAWFIMKLGKAGEGRQFDSISSVGQALT